MDASSEKSPLLHHEAAIPSSTKYRPTIRRRIIPALFCLLFSIYSYVVISQSTLLLTLLDLVTNSPSGTINDNDDLEPQTKTPICLTPSCVHASSELLYNLSPDYQKVDACTDFEELVCGGWRERNDLRPDQGDAFTGTFMAEASQTLLRHILEAPYPQDSAVSIMDDV